MPLTKQELESFKNELDPKAYDLLSSRALDLSGKDQSLQEIFGDPDKLESLLESKRSANGEAKRYREELEGSKKTLEEMKREMDILASKAKSANNDEKIKELTEKYNKQISDYENKLKENDESHKNELSSIIINNELKLALKDAGCVDANDVMKLIDRSKIRIEDGQVVGIKETVDSYKEAKPLYFNLANVPKTYNGLPKGSDPKGRMAQLINEKELAEKNYHETGNTKYVTIVGNLNREITKLKLGES